MVAANRLTPRSADQVGQASWQRPDQDAMLVDADHEVRTWAPPAVLVKVPPSLDPLHGCAAFAAGRRGKRDQLLSGHRSHDFSLPVTRDLSVRPSMDKSSRRLFGRSRAYIIFSPCRGLTCLYSNIFFNDVKIIQAQSRLMAAGYRDSFIRNPSPFFA
jgi:hypothetical protein